MPSTAQLLTPRRGIHFLADVFTSAVVSGVLSMMAWGLYQSMGPGWGLLVTTPLGLVFLLLIGGPFVVMPIYGVMKSRYGFVVGPIVLGLAAYGFSVLMMQKRDAEISALIPPAVEPARTDHAVLAIDGGSIACDQNCITVLATSAYAVARTSEYVKDHRWLVYKAAAGQVCFEQENAALALEFVRQGYPGKCAVKETAADFGDGLMLRTRAVDRYHLAPDLPKTFHGNVYEFYERIAQHDRLLARRMDGVQNSSLPGGLLVFGKRTHRFDIGPPIDDKQFLANALKIPVDDLYKRRQPYPFDDVLGGIEKYFGRKELVDVSRRQSIEGLAEYVWWGTAAAEGRAHADALQRGVNRLLASDDPIRISAALQGLFSFEVGKRSFADERLLELAFVPLPDQAATHLYQFLNSRVSFRDPITVPDALRERARSRLNEHDLTAAQRKPLELIGGP